VQLVNVPLVGVPKRGVISVGLVDKTTLPVPVLEVTPVPPEATARALANVTTCAALMVTAVVPAVCRARTPEASAVWTKPPDPELLALIVVVMG